MNVKDLVGKKISKINVSAGAVLLLFDDGTCCKVCPEEGKFDITDQLSDHELHWLGLLSADELSKRLDAARFAVEKSHERWEREQYERLKSKFEGARRVA